MRDENAFFDKWLVEEVVSMEHHHVARHIDVLYQPLLNLCDFPSEESFSHFHVHSQRNQHLVVDLGIQSLKQVVCFVLLLQLFIGWDVCKVYDTALLFVEIQQPAINYYGLGIIILSIDAGRRDQLANFVLVHGHHLVHLYFGLTLYLHELVVKRALWEDLCKRV